MDTLADKVDAEVVDTLADKVDVPADVGTGAVSGVGTLSWNVVDSAAAEVLCNFGDWKVVDGNGPVLNDEAVDDVAADIPLDAALYADDYFFHVDYRDGVDGLLCFCDTRIQMYPLR